MVSFAKFFQSLFVAGMLMTSASVYAVVDCSNATPYEEKETYIAGDQVTYKDQLYQAKWWTTRMEPVANNDPWEYMGPCVEMPTYTFVTPAKPGEIHRSGEEVLLEVTINDPELNAQVEKVRFYNDGASTLGEATRAPYRVVWKIPFPLRHYLGAEVTLKNGKKAYLNTNIYAMTTEQKNQCEGVSEWNDLSDGTEVVVGSKVQHYYYLYEATSWMENVKAEEPFKSEKWKALGHCIVDGVAAE